MKKYIIAIALAATSAGFAQSSIKGAKEDAANKTEKVKETVKSAQNVKGLKDAKEVQKEYTASEKEEMKAAAKRAKENVKEAVNEDVKENAKKLKAQTDNAASDLKSTVKKEVSEVKNSSETSKNNDLAKSIKGADVKGAVLGKARASEAQKMIELKEIEMTTNDAYIDESRRRISIAKDKLQEQISAGSLSEEEIVSKKGIIEKAEARLANYESDVKNSKLKLREQKNKILNLYDTQ